MAEQPTSEAYFRFQLHPNWGERPYFRSPVDWRRNHFQGRGEELRQLTDFFVSGSGGTVLVSGHRGVGKTATVDMALIDATRRAAYDTRRRQNQWLDLLRLGLISPSAMDRHLEGQVQLDPRPKEMVVVKLDYGHITPGTASDWSHPRDVVEPRRVLTEIIKRLHEHFSGANDPGRRGRSRADRLAELRGGGFTPPGVCHPRHAYEHRGRAASTGRR